MFSICMCMVCVINRNNYINMCDDIQNCCRICLDVDSEHVSILEDATIGLHLKSCLSMSVSALDHLPKEICISCVSQLNQFYNFQINARCSQDWLESSVQEMLKKTTETKTPILPLPDSEYNSDSLLEFLNNTANIEEYLNNLGKEDIPSIVNLLDKNDQSSEISKATSSKTLKIPSPKKKDKIRSCKIKSDTDVLDPDVKVIKGSVKKAPDSKIKPNFLTCMSCKVKFDNVLKLSQHVGSCDGASRTCMQCQTLFDTKMELNQHMLNHSRPLSCNCGEQFQSKSVLVQHRKTCQGGQSAGTLYRCKECGESFRDRFMLYRHAKEHITSKMKEMTSCDICGHNFITHEALVKHKKEEHEKPENLLYRCKVCNYTSENHKEMFIHVKKHMFLTEPQQHLCESCGHSFATRASLVRHSQQHNQNKIKCRICNTHFASEKELEVHLMEHVEMVMCERCGETVINYKLSEHMCG